MEPPPAWDPFIPEGIAGSLIPKIVERARAGQLRLVGDGANLVDTVYIDNAAAAHLQAADALSPDSPVAGRAYFISQDEPVAMWPWIRDLFRALDLPEPRLRIPLGPARAAGGLFGLVGLLLLFTALRFLEVDHFLFLPVLGNPALYGVPAAFIAAIGTSLFTHDVGDVDHFMHLAHDRAGAEDGGSGTRTRRCRRHGDRAQAVGARAGGRGRRRDRGAPPGIALRSRG